jgi:hypothetical protein
MIQLFLKVYSRLQCVIDTRTTITKTMPLVNPSFSSMPPYQTLLQAFIISLMEICAGRHKIYIHTLFYNQKFSNATNQQSVGKSKLLISLLKATELVLKWCQECYQLLISKYSSR